METTHDGSTEMVVLDEAFIRITHQTANDLIVLRWKGYADPTNYRKGLNTGLDHVQKHGIKRWLADLRHMDAILASEEKWTNEDWFPRLIKAGKLRRMAILPSKDFFNKMSVERIMDYSAGAIQFKVGYFPDEPSSMEWLFDEAMSAANA
ncbi:MAG: hypothetical protein IPP83_15095 [Flavobacteriales bacterium]|nr:hypothetical protein [Flavobacteriales bacterium]